MIYLRFRREKVWCKKRNRYKWRSEHIL